jgi:signal transduction histidine kinase
MDQAELAFAVEIPDERVIALGDEDSIHRLFSILLENAAKFTPPGGSIRIAIAVQESHVAFTVQDCGLGIATEHKQHIFDRFYRAVPAGGSPAKGSGLGLALAKWIAERHGTELKVESEAGCGSSFSFCLQRADQALPAKDAMNALKDLPRRTEKAHS